MPDDRHAASAVNFLLITNVAYQGMLSMIICINYSL
jgi:hypothetical protein